MLLKTIILSFLLSITAIINAVTYYVSSSGSNSNNGLSSSTPWDLATLKSNWSGLADGSTILFARGSKFNAAKLYLSNKNNITFSTYGTGAKPQFLGSTVVGTFTSIGGSKWTATVANILTGRVITPTALFINGNFNASARYPAGEGFINPLGSTAGGNEFTLIDNNTNYTTSELVNGILAVRVTSYNYEARKITSNSLHTINIDPSKILPSQTEDLTSYCLRNVSMGLLANGDWTISGTTLTLYSTINPNTQNIDFISDTTVAAFTNISGLTLQNISFGRANLDGVFINGCTNVLVDSCDFTDAGSDLLLVNNINGLEIKTCYFLRGHTNGLYVKGFSGVINIHDNNFKKIFFYPGIQNQNPSLMSVGACVAPIYGAAGSNLKVNYNRADSIGIFLQPHLNEGDVQGSFNFITNYGAWLGDLAGIYLGGSTYNQDKYFKHNIILNVMPTNYKFTNTTPELFCHALYTDYQNFYNIVDSNVIVGTNVAWKINEANSTNTFSNNIIYDASRDMNVNENWNCVFTDNSIFNQSNPNTYTNITNNTFILGPSSRSLSQRFYLLHGTPMATQGYNYNTFISPFYTDVDPFRRMGLYYQDYVNDYNLSEFTAAFGKEVNSTFNPQNWQFIQTTGISENDFVKVFINVSRTNHTFSLGNCVFKDVDGNTTTDNITVTPYYAKALFYVSGNISTIDNLIYDVSNTYVPPTPPPTPNSTRNNKIKTKHIIGNLPNFYPKPVIDSIYNAKMAYLADFCAAYRAGNASDTIVPIPVLPSLTALNPSNITSYSASLTGNISSDGNTPILARGFCWNTSGNPTLNNNSVSAGTGTGQFTSNITNLDTVTTYYYKAFATNIIGTSYSQERSFETNALTPDPPINQGDFNIVYAIDFENESTGNWSYDRQQIVTYSGLYEWGMGHRTDVYDPQSDVITSENSNKYLRVNFQYQTYSTGSGTSFEVNLPTELTEAYLTYNTRFKPGFDPVLGGKMLGLGGGLVVVPYPPTGSGGFGVISMWNEMSTMNTYAYHHGYDGLYGQGGAWNLNDGSSIDAGNWVNVTIRVVMNDVGSHNGILEAWINKKLVYSENFYEWRTNEYTNIETIIFTSFFGGSGSEFRTNRDEYIDFDDVTVFSYKDYVNTTRGLNLSPSNRVLDLPITLK